MRKVLIFLSIIFISFIPIYFIVLWEPELAMEVSGNSITNESSADNIESEDESNSIYKNDVSDNDKNVKNIDKEELSNKESSILRVNITAINEQMNKADKKNLKKIIYKLPVTDIEYIESLKNIQNSDEATKKFINVLKRGLSSTDYEQIKSILTPFINFDEIK